MKEATFSKRLQELLDRKGIKAADLVRATGIDKSRISHYLKGDWNAKQDSLLIICEKYNVDPAWLMGYDVPMQKENMFNNINLPKNIIPLPDMIEVPLVGSIACGTPITAEENIDGYIRVPASSEADFALTCKGDSMINARISDGDIVFIRKQPDVENGEIAAVLIEEEATLKRVYKMPNQIMLVAENTAYPPMIYSGETLNEIRILGKAVYFISAIK